jgi:pimeloyl-ACP methyl ester carboxylesterase
MKPATKASIFLLLTAQVFTGCARYATVAEKRPVFQPVRSTVGALVSVQQGIASGLKTEKRAPLTAVGEFLTAAQTAAQQLQRDPRDRAARDAYNFALARVFSTLRAAKIAAWGEPLRVPAAGGEWLLSGRTDLTKEPILPKLEFIPADQIELGGTYVSQRFTKDGLGAPLIATLRGADDILKRDPFAQGKNIYYGVTAVARFEGRRCVVTFEDPLAKENVPFAGGTQPLAADYTASIALMLAREKPDKLGIARLLNPAKYAETARLARLQPYDPAKIPMLCVHGLASTPSTWTPMLNTLRADPEIRKRYQFWFYSYPSGYPYPYSAALLRKQLDAIGAKYPGHKKIVVVGHSMGGCISRLLVTDTGERIWRDTFGKSPAETAIAEEHKKVLMDGLVFQHRKDVGRVIFVSAPLRGADMAGGWLGRLGSKLIHAPATFTALGRDALKVATFQHEEMKVNRIPNSVDTLAPNNRFVKAINAFPLTPGIPVHTICGDRGKGGNKDHAKPQMSDGFVPYWSSHLDGAKSELIVPSNHSAHQNPLAIAEVKRILMLNARQ